MIYNVSYGVAAICILVIIVLCVTFRISNNSVQSKRFLNLIIAMLFATFFDTAAGLTINYHAIVPVWINILVNTIGFASIISAVYCYVRYIDILVHNDGKENKTMVIINRCVYGTYMVILAANSFFGFIFDFDSEGRYCKTEFYLLIYAVPLYYSIYCSVLLLYNHRKFVRKQIIAIFSFCQLLLIGALLQFIFSDVLLIMFVSTLSLIVILFFLETPDYQKLNNTMHELDKAKQEAVKANKAKSEFLSNMSHEIRTPINAVLGLNEMIMRESDNKQITEYAANIQSAGRTLLSIINDILDLSKIESGKMEIVPVEYDVSSLVNDIVNMVKIRAEKKNLKFIPEIDEKIPSVLYGDDVRLRQVITNILTNAVKYTHEGHVRLKMKAIQIEDGVLRLEVSVSDTGIGIKEEDIDKLFTSFQRLDQEKNRSIEGTGLGITIVSHLLGMMGSKLNVSSVYGAGSTFSFVVEQKIVNPEPMGNYEKRFKMTADSAEDGVMKTAPNVRILVVDDNETNLLVARSLLKRTLAKVETAGSGKECIELLQKNIYDIVFLDHMMPEMDGIETLKRIKEEQLGVGTIFVALTANAVHGAKQTYLEAGFDDYLSKPFTGHDIEKCLFGHISRDMIKFADSPDNASSAEGGAASSADVGSVLDIEKALEALGGDTNAYMDCVYDFCDNNRCNDLELDFSIKDLGGYRINLKKAAEEAQSVGLTELAEASERLISAAEANDTDYIAANHNNYIKMYRKASENIEAAAQEYFS